MDKAKITMWKKGNKKSSINDAGAVISAFAQANKEAKIAAIAEASKEQMAYYTEACNELAKTKESIRQLINSNRGGGNGVHGFIAERLEVGMGNAMSIMSGDGIRYVLLDDNGRDDLLIDSCPVQMKFVQRALGLDAIKEHMTKYPEAMGEGVIYMLPRDYLEKVQKLYGASMEEAKNFQNTDSKLWQKMHELRSKGLTSDKIWAAEFDYNEARKNTYEDTIAECERKVARAKKNAINKVIAENVPSIAEAGKTIAIGAGIEATLRGVFTVIEKHQNGVDIPDYSNQDFADVIKESGKGALNGGLRSGVIYLASNFTPIPAGIASGVYTVAEKAIEIGINAEDTTEGNKKAKEEILAVAVETAFTTALSMAGAKYFKKNKVVGAIIGTATAKTLIFTGKKLYGLANEPAA